MVSMEQAPSNFPEFLTPQQAARSFQVRETTVRLWLQRGLMRGVKIGHTWRIPRSAIEEFANPQSANSQRQKK
jgi:excisionase family DNA binding protein